jgi:hypothetical protein
MSSADDVIATLEQAKQKLRAAKRKGLQGASVLSKSQASVGHALGRSGVGSPLLAEMRAKEKAVVEQVMRIDLLIDRVDQAIAQTRSAGKSGAARSNPDAPRRPA